MPKYMALVAYSETGVVGLLERPGDRIYNKIGVSTRAAAALYAMEHRLL